MLNNENSTSAMNKQNFSALWRNNPKHKEVLPFIQNFPVNKIIVGSQHFSIEIISLLNHAATFN